MPRYQKLRPSNVLLTGRVLKTTLTWLNLCDYFIFLTDKPNKPVGPLEVTDITADHVKLSWQPPEYDGGSRLTSYLIEKSEARRPKWYRVERVGPTETTAELDNLVENTDYFFRVFAENKMGLSAPLESDKPVKPVSPFGKSCPPLKKNIFLVYLTKRCCAWIVSLCKKKIYEAVYFINCMTALTRIVLWLFFWIQN